MTTRDEILTYLAEHKDVFAKEYGIVKIGLFGSFGRGDANETSDIDLLIELQKGLEHIYEKKRNFKTQLESHFNRPVDIAREKYLTHRARNAINQDLIYV